MSRTITPSQTITTRPEAYCNSIANFSKRVYPLNLMASKFQESHKHRYSSSERVPEFICEYIKDPARPILTNKTRPATSHTRCRSVNYTPKPQSTYTIKNCKRSNVPYLSYKDFKSAHLQSQHEEKMYVPQIINISKRSKIILHSAKPISIDPAIYRPRKSSAHRKSQNIEKRSTTTEQNIDISSVYTPGLTYGEKIIKLKALISTNLQ